MLSNGSVIFLCVFLCIILVKNINGGPLRELRSADDHDGGEGVAAEERYLHQHCEHHHHHHEGEENVCNVVASTTNLR